MPEASVVQANFLGGEWSKSAQGRVDLPAYKTAMNVCLNGLPREEGAWVRRSGTLTHGNTYKNYPGVLRRIVLPGGTPAVVEITYNSGASYVRLWTAPQADVGLLADDTVSMTLFSDDAVLLTSPSRAN